MSTTYAALTAYNVPIPRAFQNRRHALNWAEAEGHRFPGARIEQATKTGVRVIWRAPAGT